MMRQGDQVQCQAYDRIKDFQGWACSIMFLSILPLHIVHSLIGEQMVVLAGADVWSYYRGELMELFWLLAIGFLARTLVTCMALLHTKS